MNISKTVTPILYALLRPSSRNEHVTRFQKLDSVQLDCLRFFKLLPLLPSELEALGPSDTPFASACRRLDTMPCLRIIQYGSDGLIFENSLLATMPIVIVVVTREVPERLAYLALIKPFIILTPDQSVHSQVSCIPNVYPVLLDGTNDLPNVYRALGSLLKLINRKPHAPAALRSLETHLENETLFSARPQLSFIQPIAIAPFDNGMAASYLANRLANTTSQLFFGDTKLNFPIWQFFEYIKLASIALLTVERDVPIVAPSSCSRKELESLHSNLLGHHEAHVKLNMFLEMGQRIEANITRGVRLITVPTIRPSLLKGVDPPSIDTPRMSRSTETVISKSVRAFCESSDIRQSLSIEDTETYWRTQSFLNKEQELLACQATLLAGRAFGTSLMRRVFISPHFQEIKDLHNTFYGRSRKSQRQFRSAQDSLASSLPDELIHAITLGGMEIVFYSDLPLEWTIIQGLPICLAKPVSRIPTSLTYFPTLYAVMENKHSIDISNSKKTLVLDLMADSEAVKRYSRMLQHNLAKRKIELTYASPRSPEAVVALLNEHEPEIVFVDAHGRFDPRLDKLYIKVGDIEIDADILFGNGLVPKVWIMSSCQTTMSDAVSGCIARKLLSRGAICVIGTLSSVDAMLAALFFSVFIDEIYLGKFLPRSRTLSEAFHNTQIYMTRVWEPLLPLLRRYERDAEMTRRINLFIEDIAVRRAARTPDLTLYELFANDAKELRDCLKDHGLLETFDNITQTGQTFPETLLFSAFGFPKGVKLEAKSS